MMKRLRALFFLTMSVSCIAHAQTSKWIEPTKEELSMTSQPEVPGAAAVYLYREEATEDNLHLWSIYVRLKVLTEEGKKYGDVRLHFMHGQDGEGYDITDIQGRTIQPDGTVVPFTGKPYEKMVEETKSRKIKQKVFSLPAVQVGSILEYRYKMRWDDNRYMSPDWYPQEDIYMRKAHYLWFPTDKELLTHENGHETRTRNIAWFPILPPGAKVVDTRLPSGQERIELNIENVKPMVEETYMPPVYAFGYKVLFYYSAYNSAEEYWKSEGKIWSSRTDKFIGPGDGVRAFVAKTVASTDTQEQKLQKLYAEVMKLENTRFSRTRTRREEGKEIKNTDAVLAAGHGGDDEMALLFIAMARAAGMEAYAIKVTDREHRLFMPGYLSFGQLDDIVAIVNVDGKERYFDPGQRYMPFGHLDWRHTLTEGLRQSKTGPSIGATPAELYSFTSTSRVGDLKLDHEGHVAGTVSLTYKGQSAVEWRQHNLRSDLEETKNELKKYVEGMLPAGSNVEPETVIGINDYESPLKVVFKVDGPAARATSSRVLVPADIFLFNAKPKFNTDKREQGIYFQYPEMLQDAVRINYPAEFSLEASPKEAVENYNKQLAYNIKSKQNGNSVTVWRNMIYGTTYFPAKEYPNLKEFFVKTHQLDEDQLVLKAGAAPASSAPGN